jgi:tetratricopeptide (TPR) repeat protein
MSLGDAQKAESAYQRLLRVDPDNTTAYARLAAMYVAQNRLSEAREYYEGMARQQSKPVAAKTMIATLLTAEGKRDEARKYYQEVLALNPRAAVAANNLAWDYAERGGDLAVALNLAQTAKAELPDEAQVSDTLGWVYYKRDLPGPAVAALREAVKQDPDSAGIHYRLGLAYLKNGDELEARQTLQRVLTLDPKFPAAADVRKALASVDN